MLLLVFVLNFVKGNPFIAREINYDHNTSSAGLYYMKNPAPMTCHAVRTLTFLKPLLLQLSET
jgi:hypothetical protein